MGRNRTIGIVADGAFKLLLAAVFGLGAQPVGRQLGVHAGVLIAGAAALLVCGAVEIRYLRRRSARAYTRLMVGYDTGWVLTAAAGLLLARGGSGAGGELWIGYQVLAPLVFAAALAASRGSGGASGVLVEDAVDDGVQVAAEPVEHR
ncbi:hypothetical protein [Kitasatospora sp. NPDC004531]